MNLLSQYDKVSASRFFENDNAPPPPRRRQNSGFTLIELSSVLVIIGLLVGGVLIGQDLIRSSQVRAQISQVEKINQAVNAFKGKFGELPGDISAAAVTRFAFPAVPTRPGSIALGDGNGIIESYWFAGSAYVNGITDGEAAWFWEDLSVNSGLIDGNFHSAAVADLPDRLTDKYLPSAKIGGGNYLYVYCYSGVDYFGLSIPNGGIGIDGEIFGASSPRLTVMQAYSIDKKIDDGLPQTGNVLARFQNWTVACTSYGCQPMWAAGNAGVGAGSGSNNLSPSTAATPATATTCYDNNNINGSVQQYSVTQNNGTGNNCALSFKFQ